MDWKDEDFIAGNLALDFLNTVANQDKNRDWNRLPGWAEILSWAEFGGLISADEAGALSGTAMDLREYKALMAFREQGYQLLSGFLKGEAVDVTSAYEATLRTTLSVSVLQQGKNGFVWRPDLQEEDAGLIRHRLVLALWSLMQGPDMARLRECGRCSWLFLNSGRGVGRKWCRMAACGNRAKSQNFRNAHS